MSESLLVSAISAALMKVVGGSRKLNATSCRALRVQLLLDMFRKIRKGSYHSLVIKGSNGSVLPAVD